MACGLPTAPAEITSARHLVQLPLQLQTTTLQTAQSPPSVKHPVVYAADSCAIGIMVDIPVQTLHRDPQLLYAAPAPHPNAQRNR